MSLVLDIDEPLTADEVEQVKTFAAFLVNRRAKPEAKAAALPPPPLPQVSFDGWAGCLAHVHPELSNKEFMRLIEDERIAEAMK